MLRSARSVKPDGLQFLEDFNKRTLDKRKEKIPELIAACKSGKRAFLVMDEIIIANNTKSPSEIMVKLMNISQTVVRLGPEISVAFIFTVVFFLFFSFLLFAIIIIILCHQLYILCITSQNATCNV